VSFTLLGILNAQAAAAGGAAAYDLLETEVLASKQSSVTFTGLGSYTDYKHLQIRAVTRGDGASNRMSLTVNSDTGVYQNHQLFGDGSTVTSTSQNANRLGVVQESTATTNSFAASVIDVLDFSDTTKNTTFRSLAGQTGGPDRIRLQSMLYEDTSAITSLEFSLAVGDFISGSRFSLYGLKAGA
jgi:hypothetical protein